MKSVDITVAETHNMLKKYQAIAARNVKTNVIPVTVETAGTRVIQKISEQRTGKARN
jgi:hypothetical protein